MRKMESTMKCDNCNRQVATEPLQGDTFPDGGLELFPLTFGYYGGFFDNFPSDLDSPTGNRVVFCHDCSVHLFRTFPSLFKGLEDIVFPVQDGKVAYGLHPCENETPCCEFAWASAGEQGKIKLVNRDTMQWEILDLPDRKW